METQGRGSKRAGKFSGETLTCNPKSEIRPEIRGSNSGLPAWHTLDLPSFEFRHSVLFRISDFGFRILTMAASDILFFIFSALALICGVMILVSRNPVNSAMFLVLTIASLAGLFVLLEAFFLAAVQVLVYAGAVMVLFLFVIMLLDLKSEERRKIKVLGGRRCSQGRWRSAAPPGPRQAARARGRARRPRSARTRCRAASPRRPHPVGGDPSRQARLMALLACVAVYAPWMVFVQVVDPPGDRLVKWHFAGTDIDTPDDRSSVEAILSEYRHAGIGVVENKDRQRSHHLRRSDHLGPAAGKAAPPNGPTTACSARSAPRKVSRIVFAPGVLLLGLCFGWRRVPRTVWLMLAAWLAAYVFLEWGATTRPRRGCTPPPCVSWSDGLRCAVGIAALDAAGAGVGLRRGLWLLAPSVI